MEGAADDRHPAARADLIPAMTALSDEEALPLALARFDGVAGAACEPLGTGLINRTFRVRAAAGDLVLQRVNPIFDPAIHENIRAVTRRLAERGVATPLLLDAQGGRPFVDLGDAGVWRLMTFVAGASFDTIQAPSQARAAGLLVARFHAALDGLEHRFVGLRTGVHDTPRHLATLREALAAHEDHRLHSTVRPLGESILAAAAALSPLADLPPRVCHGDLKFSNVVFAGAAGPAAEDARALVDLDTVGPMALAFELGDAWRSWCNPHGEERDDAIFDMAIYAASLDGYLAGLGRPLSSGERAALVGGVEWISLELAARFAADALNERYFGWDPARFPGRGEHNLLRARSQWALHLAVVATRPERAGLLGVRV